MPLDPDALLCENCGYHLAGLAPETNCPECGRPIIESLPAKRTGTAWQQRPGLRAWVHTILLPYRAPLGMWDRIRIDRRVRTDLFAFLTLLAAGVTPAVGAALIQDNWASPGGRVLFALVNAVILFFPILIVAFGIEIHGIRFFGRNHRWRITRDVAHAVCAYATPGWFVGSLASLGLFAIRDVGLFNWFLLGCAFIGLLSFETLVYIGMRRTRFANVPGAMLHPDAQAGSDARAEEKRP